MGLIKVSGIHDRVEFEILNDDDGVKYHLEEDARRHPMLLRF